MDNDSLYQETKKLVESNQQQLAIKTCLRAIDSLPTYNSKRAQWLVLTGDIFNDKKEQKKAIYYYRKAYVVNSNMNDSLALMQDHIKIGIQHNLTFLKNLKDSISKDSTIYYYKKNINGFSNVKNGEYFTAQSHTNLAFLYSKLNNLKKAEYHIYNAIEYYKKTNDLLGLNTSYLNLGLILIYQNKYNEAEKINLDILNNKKDSTDIEYLKNYKEASGNLAYIYQQTKRFEIAYDYSEKYNEYSELIADKQKATEIRAIEAQYNVEKATQAEQLKTLKEKEAKERMYLWSGIGGITALSIILFGSILYRNSKLKAKNLALSLVQQELNKQQELKQLQIQNQSKVLSATLDGREKERKDIAQTLHDSVSALLSSVSMHIQVAKKKTTTEIEELDKSHRILGEASDKVRDLSHQLLSAVLVKFGLAYAVDDMCEKYSNSELTLELECDEVIPRFEVDIEVKLKNIIEEFINNIIKHSKASIATVSLDYQNENLEIIITDNGVGFDTSIISPKSGGVGLSQIKARVESLGGSISIESAPKKGTEVNMIIPVKRRENA